MKNQYLKSIRVCCTLTLGLFVCLYAQSISADSPKSENILENADKSALATADRMNDAAFNFFDVENDVCENAITLVCNQAPGSYSSAESTAVNTTTCSIGDNGLWFTFTGNGDNITISSTASFDHELAIGSGSCNAIDPIICKDAALADGTETHLILASTPGLQYYVYVAHFAENNTTTGDLTMGISCVTPPPAPENDFCADAIALNCGQTVEGYTTSGTTETVGTCVTALNTSPGVWYTFEGDGNFITATTCSADGPFFDTKIGVFTGSCGELICVTGNDDSPLGASDLDCTIGESTIRLASTVNFGAVQGTTYYILVTGFDTATGDFDLTVTCEGFDCPAIEANIGDDCDDGDPATFFDVVQEDCSCAGVDNPCIADPGCLAITTSDAYSTVIADDPFCCDTSWDEICQAAYIAAGGMPDITNPECIPDCPDLGEFGLNIGDPCDDGNSTTYDDVVNAECNCVGIPFDCPLLSTNFGDPCGTYGTTQSDCSCFEVAYCPSGFSNTTDEYISNVNYAGISNPSGSTVYSNYDITFNISAGETSPITVSVTNATDIPYTETVRVWIDFNQDGTYDPLTEQFDIGTQLVPGQTTLDFTADIAVPADALPGVTGMRVSMRFNAYATPCEVPATPTAVTFGEVENYMVNISASQSATLNGTITWNAACGDRATTVRLYEPGTNNLVGTYNTTVGADGSFSIANVAQGTFDVFVKVTGQLQKGFADVSISTGSNNLVVGSVVAGDANNDNGINIDDITIVLDAFGTTTGNPNFNPLADLNCDGDVNIDDLTLVLNNFGQSGDNAPLP